MPARSRVDGGWIDLLRAVDTPHECWRSRGAHARVPAPRDDARLDACADAACRSARNPAADRAAPPACRPPLGRQRSRAPRRPRTPASGVVRRGQPSDCYPATQRSRRHSWPCPPAVRRRLHLFSEAPALNTLGPRAARPQARAARRTGEASFSTFWRAPHACGRAARAPRAIRRLGAAGSSRAGLLRVVRRAGATAIPRSCGR